MSALGRRSRAAVRIFTLFVAVTTPCCQRAKAPLRLETQWIEDTTAASLESPDALYQREAVARWQFEGESDLAGWLSVGLDYAFRIDPAGGLVMRSSTPDPCLWRPVDFLAADVDEIRIVRSPLSGGRVQVFWQGDGDTNFTEANSVEARAADPGGNLLETFTFRLQGNPGWRGRIRFLRFDLTEIPEHQVVLHSIQASRYSLDADRVAAAVATPLRVDFEHREMLARLAPPGLPWARDVEIRADSRLTFSYGLQQGSGPAITFDLRFEDAAGATPLFTASLGPAAQGRIWVDAAVDLSPLAGRRGRLIFETRADTAFDPRHGFPLWGNPELAVAGRAGEPGPWNLVWILVDTLRADRLSLYGYPKATSPHLDAWAGTKAATFTNAIAPAPWTLPSHVTMFTGQGPLRHGVNYNLPAPASLTLLPEHLRQHGYSTAAVTGGAFVRPSYGLSQGFDRFVYFQESEGKRPSVGKDLSSTLAAATAFLAGRPAEPFFLFFHTYEVHSPYVAHEPYFTELYGTAKPAEVESLSTQPNDPAPANGWRQSSRLVVTAPAPKRGVEPYSSDQKALLDALYDSGIRATDDAIAALLSQLEDLDLDRRTMVIVSSDHGEALGEHGAAGHYNLYDTTLRVPLVIAWPDGRGSGQTIATQVRLLDLAATITESLGVPPLPRGEGQSLVPLLDNPDAPFPNEALSVASSTNWGMSLRIANRQKLIYQPSLWSPVRGGRELFDLAADPGELDDRSPQESGRVASMVQGLAARFAKETANVVVEVHNRSSAPLEFALRGDVAHAFTAKGFEQPSAATFAWEGSEIRVRVPPGTDLEFYLDGHAAGEFAIRLRKPGAEASPDDFAPVLKISDLTTPAVFHWRDGWRSGGSAAFGPADTGVVLRWHGPRSSDQQGPAAPDSELKRQLEALGYVH